MLVCALVRFLCTRDRGCSAHPVFPAPSSFGANDLQNFGRNAPRDRKVASAALSTSLRANGSGECPPDDRLREAIHFAPQRKKEWIASSQGLLAMTALKPESSNIHRRPARSSPPPAVLPDLLADHATDAR